MIDFSCLPRGWKFVPTEEDLVLYYLKNKIENQPLPLGLIDEVNLYGDKNPWEIFPHDSTEYFYVYTHLKRRKKRRHNENNIGDNGEFVRFDRTAGIGFWKGRQCNNKDDQNSAAWFKKDFIFEVRGKPKNFDHGRWIMMELSLPQCEDYVICRIYNKNAKKMQDEMLPNPSMPPSLPLSALYPPDPFFSPVVIQPDPYYSCRDFGIYRTSPTASAEFNCQFIPAELMDSDVQSDNTDVSQLRQPDF